MVDELFKNLPPPADLIIDTGAMWREAQAKIKAGFARTDGMYRAAQAEIKAGEERTDAMHAAVQAEIGEREEHIYGMYRDDAAWRRANTKNLSHS